MIEKRTVLDCNVEGLPREVYDEIMTFAEDWELSNDSFMIFNAKGYESDYPILSKYILDAGYEDVTLLVWW